MKKEYKMPQTEIVEIKIECQLLAGSGNDVNAGITVDDMGEMEE